MWNENGEWEWDGWFLCATCDHNDDRVHGDHVFTCVNVFRNGGFSVRGDIDRFCDTVLDTVQRTYGTEGTKMVETYNDHLPYAQ